MRIGISILTHADQSIWESGLFQKVIFLAQGLQALPFVRRVALIDAGDQLAMPPQANAGGMALPTMNAAQASDETDVVIDVGAVLDPRWLSLQRARGKKTVHFCTDHPFTSVVEPAVFDKPGRFPPLGCWDEIWLSPEHEAFASVQRVLQRCPVRVAPFLWSPRFLLPRIAEVEALGYRFGWKPGSRRNGLHVAIFEPNVSVNRSAVISMLACDEAFRAEPGSVASMNVLNSLHLKDHPTMLHLAHSLDLVRQHKAVFLGRHDFVGFMVQHADAVVSHQWASDRSNGYLDTLHGDYPLVHNSAWLRGFGAGYHYPDFDCIEAGRQLRLARAEHDERLEDQQRAKRALFAAVDPAGANNLASCARLLRGLCDDSPGLWSA